MLYAQIPPRLLHKPSVDWVGGLADDTWRNVATHLGLHALTLRRTSATFQKRVLALKELPVAVQLARRLLQLLETLATRCGCNRNNYLIDDEFYAMDASTAREYNALWSAMQRASYQEFFAMIDVLRCTDKTYASKRPCSQLIDQFLTKTRMWDIFDRKAKLNMQLRPVWNGKPLSNEELVYVMKRFREIASIYTITSFPDDDGWYTTTWHLAALQGNLEVLNFLYRVSHPALIHRTTIPGNHNALFHARLGLERARRGQDANLEQRLLATIAFLKKCGLEDGGG